MHATKTSSMEIACLTCSMSVSCGDEPYLIWLSKQVFCFVKIVNPFFLRWLNIEKCAFDGAVEANFIDLYEEDLFYPLLRIK